MSEIWTSENVEIGTLKCPIFPDKIMQPWCPKSGKKQERFIPYFVISETVLFLSQDKMLGRPDFGHIWEWDISRRAEIQTC